MSSSELRLYTVIQAAQRETSFTLPGGRMWSFYSLTFYSGEQDEDQAGLPLDSEGFPTWDWKREPQPVSGRLGQFGLKTSGLVCIWRLRTGGGGICRHI